MTIEPYLYFGGRCEEALNFYREAIGAEVLFQMRFDESPEPCGPEMTPEFEKKIMHATFKVGDSTLMASDGRPGGGEAKFDGISLTLNANNDGDAKRYFEALSQGGGVQHMPLTMTFFASSFGMLADKFGVMWMVLCALPMEPK